MDFLEIPYRVRRSARIFFTVGDENVRSLRHIPIARLHTVICVMLEKHHTLVGGFTNLYIPLFIPIREILILIGTGDTRNQFDMLIFSLKGEHRLRCNEIKPYRHAVVEGIYTLFNKCLYFDF